MQILLASMPWAIFNRPSIQLSSLKEYLRAQDSSIIIATSHSYLSAARKIGLEPYRIISEDAWAGEALYCSLLFPEQYENAKSVFRDSLGREKYLSLPDFDDLAELLDTHLNNWISGHQFDSYLLAGFSVCFSQLPATLLAAKRLKTKFPQLPVLLGGSSCSPQIGRSLLNVFPEIDFIINGEGERPLYRLVKHLAGKTADPGPNVQCRDGSETDSSHLDNDEIDDINLLPMPDFDDYFQELRKSGLSFIPSLPVEFSRGCWWNKCAFCNLNLQWCGYRFKKHTRMIEEIEQLTRKYKTLDFTFTDNSLPPKEAELFLNKTAHSTKNLHFFGEVRTVAQPEKYNLYFSGGLRSIQIGIEALSDSLLERMNKGIRVIENVAAMKFAHEAEVELDGNLILEFPGSTEEEVAETCRVLDYIIPYRPLSAAGFFLGHGSPVWYNLSHYGVQQTNHHPYNRKLYPKSLLNSMVMLVQSYRGDKKHQQRIWKPVREKIRAWKKFHASRKTSRHPLAYRDGGDFIIIRQEIPGKETLHHRLQGLSRKLYLACNTPATIQQLLAENINLTEKQLQPFLDDLQTKRLLIKVNDLYLALAVKEK